MKIAGEVFKEAGLKKRRRILSQYIREAYGHKERKGHPQIA